MIKLKKKKKAGFTLIEFIVYSALITVIVGMIVLVSVNVMGARARIITREEISHNVRFVLETIRHEIRNAQEIDTAGGSQLQLIDAVGDTVTFDLDEGAVTMAKFGGTAVALTSDLVNVSSLQFTDVSYEDTPGTIKIEMTIKFVNDLERPEWEFEKTFYTTESLRG